jgi:hypothetical protein
VSHRLDHAPHLTIATLTDGDAIPAIGAFATALFNGAKLGHPIFKLHAVKKLLTLLEAQST